LCLHYFHYGIISLGNWQDGCIILFVNWPSGAVMELEALRQKIDQLDIQLVDLLNRRAAVVQEIGKLKQNASWPICQPTREAIVFDNVFRTNKGPLSWNQIQYVYQAIIEVMRTMQIGHEVVQNEVMASSRAGERKS